MGNVLGMVALSLMILACGYERPADVPEQPDASISTSECGDGVVLDSEVCDDGNPISGDGCSADCKSNETCGNQITDTAKGEVCDDGNIVDGDGCAGNCLSFEICGNGVKNANEVCDDGNRVSGDGCAGDCHSDESCGNMIVDTAVGEVCDDGLPVGGPCAPDCKSGAGCGNGELETSSGEECDDGNSDNSDNCVIIDGSYQCKISRCGDGIVALNATGLRREECDGGSPNHSSPGSVETAACNIDCTNRVCGDGKVNNHAGEVCDDQNNLSCGTCSANCQASRVGHDCPAGVTCQSNNDCTSNVCSNNVCQ